MSSHQPAVRSRDSGGLSVSFRREIAVIGAVVMP